MKQEELKKRGRARDAIIHSACPSILLHGVQKTLRWFGLRELSIMESVLAIVVGLGLFLYMVMTRFDPGPESRARSKERLARREELAKGMRRDRKKNSMQDVARRRNISFPKRKQN